MPATTQGKDARPVDETLSGAWERRPRVVLPRYEGGSDWSTRRWLLLDTGRARVFWWPGSTNWAGRGSQAYHAASLQVGYPPPGYPDLKMTTGLFEGGRLTAARMGTSEVREQIAAILGLRVEDLPALDPKTTWILKDPTILVGEYEEVREVTNKTDKAHGTRIDVETDSTKKLSDAELFVLFNWVAEEGPPASTLPPDEQDVRDLVEARDLQTACDVADPGLGLDDNAISVLRRAARALLDLRAWTRQSALEGAKAEPPKPATLDIDVGTVNPVGALQELAQKRHVALPRYEFVSNLEGESIRFTAVCRLGDLRQQSEPVMTKQAAKTQAAALVLRALRNREG